MKPFAEVAVAFATALVEGDYDRAHEVLASKLRKELTPDGLRKTLLQMCRTLSDDAEPHSVHFDEEFQAEDWANKQKGDVGWAYVGIHGDGFVEAVAVVVADINGSLLIREIEWGRP